MPDYSKGQIFKIVDTGLTKCYIGSTIQPLCYRMTGHKVHYRNYSDGKAKYCSSFSLFNEFGIENCKIVWVKDFPCNSKKELDAEEGKIQQETECVNKVVAGRTRQQRDKANAKRDNEKRRQERSDNPMMVREKARQAYQKYKAVMNRPYNCECGATVCFRAKSRHFKTKKHQQYLQNQNNPQE